MGGTSLRQNGRVRFPLTSLSKLGFQHFLQNRLLQHGTIEANYTSLFSGMVDCLWDTVVVVCLVTTPKTVPHNITCSINMNTVLVSQSRISLCKAEAIAIGSVVAKKCGRHHLCTLSKVRRMFKWIMKYQSLSIFLGDKVFAICRYLLLIALSINHP